jgi:polysaccharide export outer membrane protein
LTVKRILLVIVLGCWPLLAAQTKEQLPKGADVPPDYIIGHQDVLAITVWKEPELSIKELVVRPDGKISLPLVGDITANGLTPKQLQDDIAGKLKEFVAAPNVFVVVLKTVSKSVSVVGQVGKPGTYIIGGPTTVLDILARVGGLTELAKEKNIKILRKENGKEVQFPFNYKDAIRGKNLQQNIQLKNGDIIMVP